MIQGDADIEKEKLRNRRLESTKEKEDEVRDNAKERCRAEAGIATAVTAQVIGEVGEKFCKGLKVIVAGVDGNTSLHAWRYQNVAVFSLTSVWKADKNLPTDTH